ncbi:MAG: response regulator transcription factor [Gemmatimonadetes bacterium]|nr:response regulator transcription factor [Gemmatimonadota bacterium]
MGSSRSTSSISVWIVEDNEDFRQAVHELLEDAAGVRCERVFANAEDLLETLNHHFAPEVILMDIGLPGMSGIEAIGRLKTVSPATHVIVLTIHEDNDRIFDAICAGASGYLLKTARMDRVLEAVREVHRGGAAMTPQIAGRVLNMFTQFNAPRYDYQLTEREKQVLSQLVEGKTKDKIASDLSLSYHTVDTHLRNIYAKLHVHSKSSAIAKALKERLVKDPRFGDR